MPLTDVEISSRLKSLPDWKVESGELTRTFSFKDFVGSLAFVNKVGDLAEKRVITQTSTFVTIAYGSRLLRTMLVGSPRKTSSWQPPPASRRKLAR